MRKRFFAERTKRWDFLMAGHNLFIKTHIICTFFVFLLNIMRALQHHVKTVCINLDEKRKPHASIGRDGPRPRKDKSGLHIMSRVTTNPVFGVSDQVWLKPGCTATEDG